MIAERTERVRLMIGADLGCVAWQAGLAVVAALSGPVELALLFAALTAATNIVYNPAVAATIPSVVDEDDLVAANALNGTIDNLVVIVGPAIGAVLLLAGSASVVFGVNAATFALSAALVSRIHARSHPVDVTERGTAGVMRQMAVGARTIAALPAARTLVCFCALVSFVYGTDTVLFVGVSLHHLGIGAEGFGYPARRARRRRDPDGRCGRQAGRIEAARPDHPRRRRRLHPPTALLTVIHSPVLATALQVLRGGSTLVVDVLAITALQRAVPGEQLARVFGVFFAFVYGAIALGALITPPIVTGLGLDGALLTMAFAPVRARSARLSLVARDRPRRPPPGHRRSRRASGCWRASASSPRPASHCWSASRPPRPRRRSRRRRRSCARATRPTRCTCSPRGSSRSARTARVAVRSGC